MAASRRAWWCQGGCRRRRVAAVALVLALGVLTAACGRSDDRSPAASPSSTAARRSVETTGATTTTIGQRDGSLGDANSSQACTLLDAPEIEAQFGGPVGTATPIFPYCQWLVGDDQSGFVAVTIIPRPIEETRRVTEVRFDVGGVGDSAFIASTRAIVFGRNGVSYSILWQKVGDFTTVETERLTALAHNLLARI